MIKLKKLLLTRSSFFNFEYYEIGLSLLLTSELNVFNTLY